MLCISSLSADDLPLRLAGVFALNDRVMCSVHNTKSNEQMWLRVGDEVAGLEGVTVKSIHVKRAWVEFSRKGKSYAFAVSGMIGGKEPLIISVEDSGLSNMVRIHEERERRRAERRQRSSNN